MIFGDLGWYLMVGATIEALYQRELERAPDPSGRANALWMARELGKSAEDIQAFLRDSDEYRALHAPKPVPVDPPLPSIEARRKWRGAFCVPNVAGLPHGRIWTPAYGTYTDGERALVRDQLKKRGYTHFVYNCAGLPYHDHYPELEDDSVRVRRDLLELLKDGFIPVVCATDDRVPSNVLRSFRDNANLIPIAFGCWEVNGPLGDSDKDKEEAQITALCRAVKAAAPGALQYVHFTAGHGSASYKSEGGWWKQMFSEGTIDGGLMSQDFGAGQPQDKAQCAAGLQDTARHLRGQVPGWEGVNLDNVAFEHTTTATYHLGMTEMEQVAYTDYLVAHAPLIVGFCDGGSSY
jgi:hypothetical protein